jgi:hypothetical protein
MDENKQDQFRSVSRTAYGGEFSLKIENKFVERAKNYCVPHKKYYTK